MSLCPFASSLAPVVGSRAHVLLCIVKFLVPCRDVCSLRLQLQLLVAGLMSYLRDLCLFALSGVQHILCCVFCFVFLRLVSYVWWCRTHILLIFCFAYLRLVSCVPNAVSFSGLFILDCPSGFSNVYLKKTLFQV